MRPTRAAALACVTFLALTVGGAHTLRAQGTRSSEDTAFLALDSRPSGKIAIDDSIVGETPKSLSIRAGTHKIRISREGYLPYEVTIVIEAGEHLRLRDIVLKEKPKQGSRS